MMRMIQSFAKAGFEVFDEVKAGEDELLDAKVLNQYPIDHIAEQNVVFDTAAKDVRELKNKAIAAIKSTKRAMDRKVRLMREKLRKSRN